MAVKPPKTSKASGGNLNNKNSQTILGNRFRQARGLISLSRTAFCLKHDIKTYTLQSWENNRYLSRGGNLLKFCQALAREGVVCSEEWLLEGTGPEPYQNASGGGITYYPAVRIQGLTRKSPPLSEKLALAEAAFFQKNCGKEGLEAVVVQVVDEAMQPDYGKEEFIGAIKIDKIKTGQADNPEMPSFHQMNCVVETRPHYFLIRRVLKEENKYILLANNKDYPLITLEQVAGIYEIVWQRKVKTDCLAEVKSMHEVNQLPKGRYKV